jgi:hypothetical protein
MDTSCGAIAANSDSGTGSKSGVTTPIRTPDPSRFQRSFPANSEEDRAVRAAAAVIDPEK